MGWLAVGRLSCVAEAVPEGVVAVLDPKIVAAVATAVEAVGAVNPAGFGADIDPPEADWLVVLGQTGSLVSESQ